MKRQAFTLVEMLVSLALVLFIMVILAQALSTGLETFRQLKATGELDEKLRMASTILRRDLQLDHFEGKRRLSDPSFWVQGPPREGFFRFEQMATERDPENPHRFVASVLEGRDGDQIPCFRMAYPPHGVAGTHRLHFSIKLRGNQREDFMAAVLPTNINGISVHPSTLPLANTTFFNFAPAARYQESQDTYTSQWAEVAYFLWPNQTLAGGSTPLFSLYRRQRLAVPDNRALNWDPKSAIPLSNATDYQLRLAQHSGISCEKADPNPNKFPDQLYFNTPTDLTIPARRFGMNPLSKSNGLPSNYQPLGTGEDLLLTDVLSFTVRILSPDMLNQQPTPARPYDHVDDPFDAPNTFVDLPFQNPGETVAFDTWSNVQDQTYNYPVIPAQWPIRITALQITLRIYDIRTQQTRQITFVQDM